MAPPFNKCQFISAEINHDFHTPKPRLNEYQDGWNINTLCQHATIAQNPRHAGREGDDDLVEQIFRDSKGEALNKKKLREFQPREYQIGAVVSPTINLSASLTSQAEADAALTPEPNIMQVPMYVAHANINATDPRGIYQVFKYPDENFLIIDAVPNFVTSILKYLRFPTTIDTSEMAPDQYTKMTTEQLFAPTPVAPGAPNWPGPWPFRPKINVINTPSTLGDPQPTCDPGAPKFSIDTRLPSTVLTSNTSAIPGGLDNQNNSCPLIYTWYYTQPETSLPNNPLMMSRYQIIMRPLAQPGSGYKQLQDWSGGGDGVAGATISPAAKQNAIENLKKTMIERGIIQATPNMSIPTPQRYNVAAGAEAEASLLVQRKRSGDYLQIKTAYEFPARAAADGNNRAIYEMILGPEGAMDLGLTGSRLSGEGNFKSRPSPARDTEWYRNRTYFCTGDWPAFCYATYNKINCILICKRKNCAGATMPDTNIIYRNYFGT
jgi:hypothetical protein